jgi:glutamate dehydrogenase
VKKGIVKSKEERNRILAEMAEEVAALVLADNENQSRALSLDALRSATFYEEYVDVIDAMIQGLHIDRGSAQVPSRDRLLASDQKSRGLPRPVLADFLGYAKMWGYDAILHSGLPDSPGAQKFLEAYFPKRMRRDFSRNFIEHPLRREIIVTAVINYVVNNGGIALLSRLTAANKASVEEAITAYLEADRASSAPAQRQRALEAGLAADAEHAALLKIEDALEQEALKRLGR